MPRRQDRSRLGEILEELCRDKQLHGRRTEDPVAFPHRYEDPGDIEVAGLIAASLSFGRVDLFRPVVERLLAVAGKHPAEFVANFRPKRGEKAFRGIGYRMCREEDLVRWIYGIGEVVRRYGSLEKCFTSIFREEGDIREMLERVSALFLSVEAPAGSGLRNRLRGSHSRGLLQLISSPKHGGPCKRWNMYLRWMVRPPKEDGIDFGLWHEIPPSRLIIPLDTHIARIARYLGLTSSKTMTWKMASEITEALKAFDPEDPVKYDFTLCHIGISGLCPVKIDPDHCRPCRLKPVCRIGRRVKGL
jgi:uncharacterized protein (TIGR02757 family)